MQSAARASTNRGDPQSGPRPSSRAGFYHYSLQWIHAEAGSIIGLAKSHYINRQEEYAVNPPVLMQEGQGGRAVGGAGLSAYINRHESEGNPELGHHLLITRGLPVRNGAELARLLDAKERKKDRTYRQYGGRMPRVGSHLILSFRWGITESAAIDELMAHAQMISDRLRVTIEGRIHNVAGQPDHAHLLLGTRVVEGGRLGRKQRALDAVSEKADGQSLTVDGRVLGATIEALRADWAERMRQASGDDEIDHRSYDRRGIPVYAVTHVPRRQIEYQKRRNSEAWRDARRRELEARPSREAGASPAPQRFDPDEGSPGLRGHVAAADQEDAARDAIMQRIEAVTDSLKVAAPARSNKDREGYAALFADQLGLDLPVEAIEALLNQGRAAASNEAVRKSEGTPTHRPSPNPGEIRVPSSVDMEGPSAPSLDPKTHAASIVAHIAASRQARIGEQLQDDVNAAVGLYLDLRHARRLSAARVAKLAAAAGMDVEAFETLARSTIESGQWNPRLTSAAPRHLLAMRVAWAQEDNEARRSRRNSSAREDRALQRTGSEQPVLRLSTGKLKSHGVAEPTSASPNVASQPANFSTLRPEAAIQHEQNFASGASRSGSASSRVPAAPPYAAGPGAIEGSAALAHALYRAHEDDIMGRAYDMGKPPPSLADVDRSVALRLRATGRSEAEIASILDACSRPGDPQEERARIDLAVANACTAQTAAWLEARPGFVRASQVLESRAEMALYRKLRREALVDLERDLTAVWVERRMRAEALAQRHKRRLDLLRDIRWTAIRLRRRRGLIVTILSVTIELAVLLPLIEHQKWTTAKEREALHDAAVAATDQLKQLRQQWRTYIAKRAKTMRMQAEMPTVGTLKPRHGDGDPRSIVLTAGAATPQIDGHLPDVDAPVIAEVRKADEPRSERASNQPDSRDEASGVEDIAPVRADAETHGDERRRLIARYALLLVARKAWSHVRARRLGALLEVDPARLWAIAHDECQMRFGHKKPAAIVPTALKDLRVAVRRDAIAANFGPLIRLMDDIAGGKDPKHGEREERER